MSVAPVEAPQAALSTIPTSVHHHSEGVVQMACAGNDGSPAVFLVAADDLREWLLDTTGTYRLLGWRGVDIAAASPGRDIAGYSLLHAAAFNSGDGFRDIVPFVAAWAVAAGGAAIITHSLLSTLLFLMCFVGFSGVLGVVWMMYRATRRLHQRLCQDHAGTVRAMIRQVGRPVSLVVVSASPFTSAIMRHELTQPECDVVAAVEAALAMNQQETRDRITVANDALDFGFLSPGGVWSDDRGAAASRLAALRDRASASV